MSLLFKTNILDPFTKYLGDAADSTMKFIKTINKEMILITIWFFVVLQFFLKGTQDQLITEGYFLYIFLGLPILLILFQMINKYDDVDDGKPNTKSIFTKILELLKTQLETPKIFVAKIIGIILFIAFFSWTIDTKNTENFMFFFNIIFFAVLIVGVLLLFRTLKGIIYSIEGWLGVLGRIVFFIPCAISDFFFYLMGQFKKSPFVVYVLIAIEIALILLYKYVPELFKKIKQGAAQEIYKDPLLLQTETKLTNYNKMIIENIIRLPKNDASVTVNRTDMKFSLSMWFYVVGMPSNKYPYNEEANIFKICDDTNFHPKIVYDGSRNICKVYCSNVDVTEFKITLQKWVHFVITYSSDIIDIFINGELVKSLPRTPESVVFKPTDNAIAGQKDGLFGGICNIQYFARAITKQEITFNYNLNKGLDPPTN
jgi:hypothetical protein